MEQRKFYQQKLLRYGYTTGSCAAGAAKAATLMLCTGRKVDRVPLMTPGGVLLELEVLDPVLDEKSASCAVRKDGGDDPDATSGLLIYARVQRISRGIQIEGGVGVGRVTKPGLDQPVGAAAINHVPRRMIQAAVQEAMAGEPGGMEVTIYVPRGEEVGRKTFNPHLGIVGGISILGTSGIVEPMSQQALIDTTRVELNMRRALGDTDLLLTVGNYGDDFARYKLGLSLERRIKCSNFVGQTLSDAAALGFHRVLLIGHIGKLVKLGAIRPRQTPAWRFWYPARWRAERLWRPCGRWLPVSPQRRRSGSFAGFICWSPPWRNWAAGSRHSWSGALEIFWSWESSFFPGRGKRGRFSACAAGAARFWSIGGVCHDGCTSWRRYLCL